MRWWGGFWKCIFLDAKTGWWGGGRREEGRALLLLSPSCFAILLPIRSLPFLWFCKWGVCEGGMKHCEATLLTSAEKKRERERRPKDKAALKCSRASAGATARVQAQRCNKEGSWMRARGREEGGRESGRVLVMSRLWCVFVLCATQLLSSTHGNTHREKRVI